MSLAGLPLRTLNRPRRNNLVIAEIPLVVVAAAAFLVLDPSPAASTQIITTWAGTGTPGFNGDGLHRLASELYFPQDVTFAASGAYIVDWNNHVVRRVTAQNTLEIVVGTGTLGDGDPLQMDRVPPGAAGTTVALNHPTHLRELADGRLLLSCWQNMKLRTYDPGTGLALVICGDDAGFAGDDGPAVSAQLNEPSQTVQAADGSIYVLDQRNQRVRRIDAMGTITTVAGTGVAGFSGDGGSPLQAQISMPTGQAAFPGGGLALDGQGRLYIADTLNQRIRRVDFDADRIETIAGNGTAALAGDGGPATDASLHNPHDLEFGPDGRLYVADEWNHVIRAIDLDTGIITTVAGTGIAGFGGDGGPPLQAMLNRPAGLAFDVAGLMYIADASNHRIRVVGEAVVAVPTTSWGSFKNRFRQNE
jgi:sugar lactone lactonase YvrE